MGNSRRWLLENSEQSTIKVERTKQQRKKKQMKTSKLLSGITGLALFAAISSAQANLTPVTVTFTVAGIGTETVAGDRVTVNAVNANSPGTTLTFYSDGNGGFNAINNYTLQTLTWFTTPDATTTGNHDLNLTRTITATLQGYSSQAGSLSQSGSLHTTANRNSQDTLQPSYADDTTVLNFGNYRLTITPLDGSWHQPSGQSRDYNLTANFQLTQLTAVPETSTVMAGAGALGLLILGAGVHSKRTVQRIG
jgi:hypothetical protein